MTAGQEDAAAPQIIIVRRGGGAGDGGHKGGAWKIAYADFMTAMMALFLVMWLVNASNAETKRMVASYFNPLKLSETIAAPKGLQKLQPGEGAGTKLETSSKEEKATSEIPTKEKKVGEKTEDTHLSDTANPGRPNLSGLGGEPSKSANVESGQAFLDPFGIARTPDNNRTTPPEQRPSQKPAQAASLAKTPARKLPNVTNPAPAEVAIAAKTPSRSRPSAATSGNIVNNNEVAKKAPPSTWKPLVVKNGIVLSPKPKKADTSGRAKKKVVAKNEFANQGAAKKKPEQKAAVVKDVAKPAIAKDDKAKQGKAKLDKANPDQAKKDAARRLAAQKRAIESALAVISRERGGPSISVVIRQDGVLISLMDNENYGMFTTGSPKPNARFAKFIGQISGVLQAHKGDLVVSGHTDARPYRTGTYNNWRLSFDRAHEVFQMLSEGGVSKDRFKRVEGYAATQLRDKKDPNAARNRRVEIFIRKNNK